MSMLVHHACSCVYQSERMWSAQPEQSDDAAPESKDALVARSLREVVGLAQRADGDPGLRHRSSPADFRSRSVRNRKSSARFVHFACAS